MGNLSFIWVRKYPDFSSFTAKKYVQLLPLFQRGLFVIVFLKSAYPPQSLFKNKFFERVLFLELRSHNESKRVHIHVLSHGSLSSKCSSQIMAM